MRLTLGAFLYDPSAHVGIMSSQARTPRNIVLLSDGTGNSSAKLMKTNVWRMYEAIDLTRGDQLALYDNGVGTSSFKPLAILGVLDVRARKRCLFRIFGSKGVKVLLRDTDEAVTVTPFFLTIAVGLRK